LPGAFFLPRRIIPLRDALSRPSFFHKSSLGVHAPSIGLLLTSRKSPLEISFSNTAQTSPFLGFFLDTPLVFVDDFETFFGRAPISHRALLPFFLVSGESPHSYSSIFSLLSLNRSFLQNGHTPAWSPSPLFELLSLPSSPIFYFNSSPLRRRTLLRDVPSYENSVLLLHIPGFLLSARPFL